MKLVTHAFNWRHGKFKWMDEITYGLMQTKLVLDANTKKDKFECKVSKPIARMTLDVIT